MLHAATMLLGLWIILLLLTLPTTAAGASEAALGAAMITALAVRAGGASGAFSGAPRSIVGAISGIGGVIAAAIATVRAALAADVTLSPGLVRIRVDAADGIDAAEVVASIGSAPGLCVVALDKDGVLAHALNEDNVDVTRVRAMIARRKQP